MRKPFATDKHSRRTRSKRGAFTLVEILVALAVMMLMMAIILVPINMGLNVFHIGKARAEVQQANQLVVNQLAAEIKQAIHVFPNEEIPGITNKAPYTNTTTPPDITVPPSTAPYFDPTMQRRVPNTARLDFLLPAIASNGSILTPPRANNYLVTYYARRLNDNPAVPYDVFTNPIVLWRAQYPYQADPGAAAIATPYIAANISNTRYGDWTENANGWLQQVHGEPMLAPSAGPNFIRQDLDSASSASHTLITPRDMALVSPVSAVPYLTRAQLQDPAVDLNGNTTIEENETRSYQPDSSFVCDDTNDDGKIDRVTMSLFLQKYDSLGAADDKSQQIRATQTVSLPNIK